LSNDRRRDEMETDGEIDRLLPADESEGVVEDLSTRGRWQRKTGEALESQNVHKLIITLIIIDAICVITDLGYVFLSPRCDAEGEELPPWLEALSYVSLVINSLFLIEIPLATWSFGWRYYSPFSPIFQHSGFHLFDALIVLGTFIFEVALRGREEELAGLLVILRLWRIVKVVGGVAVGVSEYNEDAAKEIKIQQLEIHKLATRVGELEQENDKLKRAHSDL